MICRFFNELEACPERYRLSKQTCSAILWAPFLIILFFFLLRKFPATRPLFNWLLLESHPVEWIQFAAFLLAAFLGARLSCRLKQAGESTLLVCFYVLISLGILFVAMEEVSWGQWIFGFEPPEALQAVNKQQELNIHNLPIMHAVFESIRVLIGIIGLVAVWFFHNEKFRKISPPFIVLAWFALIAVLALLDLPNYHEVQKDNRFFYLGFTFVEVLELLIAVTALLYVWLNSRMLKKLS